MDKKKKKVPTKVIVPKDERDVRVYWIVIAVVLLGIGFIIVRSHGA